MSETILRIAKPSDQHSLAELKHRFVQNMYRGYLSQETLRRITPDDYHQEFSSRLSGGNVSVAVLEQDSAIQAAVIFGDDPSSPGCGLILEAMSAPRTGWDDKHAVLGYTVRQLGKRGCSRVHLWILRSNFHIRYICEQFGFREDGALVTHTIGGEPHEIMRYQYPLQATGAS